MTGEQTRMLWALVYLVGFAATHFFVQQGFSETFAWVIWIVILVVSSWSAGKTVGKIPAPITQAWKGAIGLFVVLSAAILLGYIPVPMSAILAAYFLIFGSLRFVMGSEMKTPQRTFYGLMHIGFGLVTTAWFADTYFLAAALIIGLPVLVMNLKK